MEIWKYLTKVIIVNTIIVMGALLPNSVSAETSSAGASVNVVAACSLMGTVNTPHTATIPSGTYRTDIGATTFNVLCNDGDGYSIYAVGYSNDEFGNTKLLANVGGTLAPAYDIITGTNGSGSTSNWAMKLTPITGTYAPTIQSDANGSYSNYHVVPTVYTKVSSFSSNTDEAIGSSMTATYAAYIAGNQPAGTYNAKVKYTLVHPTNSVVQDGPKDCVARYICYWPNAGSDVIDTMGNQSASGNNVIVSNLWASNFKRPGYGFAGWSDKYDWILNENDAYGNGTVGTANEGYHIYGPNAHITTPSNMNSKGLSLYAVWVPSAGNFQDWTGCNSLDAGEITALTDLRDNDTYAVAKLADGNCWMMENLRLDNTADHNSDGTLAQGYGSGFVGLAEPEVDAFYGTRANSLYSTNGSNGTVAITGSYQEYRFPRYRNDNTNSNAGINPNVTVANMTSSNQNVYSYGNYYTWPAAIASFANIGQNQQISNTSICPSGGWRLPTGGYQMGFSSLDIALGGSGDTQSNEAASQRWRSYPNNYVYSGYANEYSSSVGVRGTDGYYWTNRSSGLYQAYHLDIDTDGVNPAYLSNNDRVFGFSIRCMMSTE